MGEKKRGEERPAAKNQLPWDFWFSEKGGFGRRGKSVTNNFEGRKAKGGRFS